MKLRNLIIKVNEWDKRVIVVCNGIGGKPITYFLRAISFFGRETIWFLLMAYFLFIWYDPRLFSYIFSTFILGLLIIAPVKRFFQRSRPFEELEKVRILEPKPTSKSFPSWHAYNVASQGLLFGYLFNSIPVTLIAIVFALIVGFSRIQLGAHYPSDVIVGFSIGILGFFLAILLLQPIIIEIMRFFEQFSSIEIPYQRFNPLLYESILYLILTIGIFIFIILFATYKRLIQLFKMIKR